MTIARTFKLDYNKMFIPKVKKVCKVSLNSAMRVPDISGNLILLDKGTIGEVIDLNEKISKSFPGLDYKMKQNIFIVKFLNCKETIILKTEVTVIND